MLRLAKKGIPGAIEAAEAALEAAHTSFDAHHCNLCRGYFYEITAEYHLLVVAAATDWSTTEAIAELNKAKQAAAESVNYFTIAEHPSAKLARNLLEKSRVRMHALNKPTQIFLSHKGKNKDLVRRFKSALVSVRYRPWLDEDALKAGANLERGLLQGMKESCAAVFFITQDFVDNGYLATEIEYAIGRERESGSDFRIITLVFKDDDGAIGEVPPLLKRFVWKHPQNELEAFTIIVEALPLDLPVPRWRSED